MKILRWTIISLAGLVAVLLLVGLFLPAQYSAQRSTLIQAPIEQVFEQVNDLTRNEAWSPWKAKDDTMVWTYGRTAVGKGASYSWTSDNSGTGTLRIDESESPENIRTTIDFHEQGMATGIWTFEELPDGVRVTWRLEGDNGWNLVARYFGLMMDSLVGPDFESGLASLKAVTEAEVEQVEEEAGSDDDDSAN